MRSSYCLLCLEVKLYDTWLQLKIELQDKGFLNQPKAKAKGIKKKKTEPWFDTETKIQKLRDKREQDKQDGKIRPKMIVIDEVPISRKTVIKHAPELWRRWYDWEY